MISNNSNFQLYYYYWATLSFFIKRCMTKTLIPITPVCMLNILCVYVCKRDWKKVVIWLVIFHLKSICALHSRFLVIFCSPSFQIRILYTDTLYFFLWLFWRIIFVLDQKKLNSVLFNVLKKTLDKLWVSCSKRRNRITSN